LHGLIVAQSVALKDAGKSLLQMDSEAMAGEILTTTIKERGVVVDTYTD
jgi:hypothetical protein